MDGTAALLIIDNQKGFYGTDDEYKGRSNPNYEQNIVHLLQACRKADLEIIHVQHFSLLSNSFLTPDRRAPRGHPDGGRATDIEKNTTPLDHELIIHKSRNSAFIDTALERVLLERDIRTLFICGLTTDHCVSTTVRMAKNLGALDRRDGSGRTTTPGRLVLVEDATATWPRGKWDAETVHSIEVEILRDEFAEIATTASVLQELGGGKRNS